MKYLQYIGILLGAVYGLFFRLICGQEGTVGLFEEFNIYSISFIWVLPIVISIIPILFARKEILESKWKQFLFPIYSILLFFLITLTSGVEDWLCILILSFPFLITSGLIGGIAGLLVSRFINKRNSNKLYSIVLLPFLLSPLESNLPSQKESFTVETSIEIAAEKEFIWNNVIEVPEITNEEFNPGFFNFIGVPRPVYSELKMIEGQEFRIGHFTDDLKLYETISRIDTLNFVEFDIHIDKSELRDLPTDQHLLNSNYFHFENISYRLVELEGGITELRLECSYSLNSKMNGYANFWAKRIIKDFEERLLNSLKQKMEK